MGVAASAAGRVLPQHTVVAKGLRAVGAASDPLADVAHGLLEGKDLQKSVASTAATAIHPYGRISPGASLFGLPTTGAIEEGIEGELRGEEWKQKKAQEKADQLAKEAEARAGPKPPPPPDLTNQALRQRRRSQMRRLSMGSGRRASFGSERPLLY